MENSIVFIGDIDYSERLQNVKIESDLDGGSTSSIFGSVLRETVTVIIYDEIEHADTLTLKFEIDGEVKDYGVFKVDKIEYDDKTTLTTVEAYTDISNLLEEFEMPNAKSTNELLEKLGLPKAPINHPIKDTSDKYYENKLKLLQDIAALTGSYVKVSPKVEFVQPSKPENLIKNGWDDFEAYGSGKNYVENWNFEHEEHDWGNWKCENRIKNEQLHLENQTDNKNAHIYYTINSDVEDVEVKIRLKSKSNDVLHIANIVNGKLDELKIEPSNEFRVSETTATISKGTILRIYNGVATKTKEGNKAVIDWIQITPIDNQHLVVEKKSLGNGLTRIQTWGGTSDIKLKTPEISNNIEVNSNVVYSLYIENNGKEELRFLNNWAIAGEPYPEGAEYMITVPPNYKGIAYLKGVKKDSDLELNVRSSNNLDFIASDPVIVEGDEYLPEHVSFELEPGEWLEPVSEVHLTTPYGENESDGEEGSGLNFSEIELIKDIKPQILPKLLELYQGFTYRKYESKHPGDPFTKPGDLILTIDKDNRPHEIFVTSRTFTDNGSWKMDVVSDIPSQEEVNTNYVGTFEKLTKIEVDKVNQEINALVQGWDDVSDQLAQINVQMQEIYLKVMNLNTSENIIPNFNGNMETYYLWEWDNPANTLKNFENIVYKQGLTSSTNFIIVDIPDSLSRWGLRFFAKGNATTGFGRVVPNTKYSYRGKVYGNNNVTLKVLEYESLYGDVTSTQSFTLSKSGYNEFSVNFNPSTQYVRLQYIIPSTVTTSNPWTVTEQMFNRDTPKEWEESAGDVKLFAESQIKILDDEIKFTSEKVDDTDYKISNTTVTITPSDGVEIWATRNKGLTIYGADDEIKFSTDTQGNVVMVGNLTAGSVGGFIVDESIKSVDGLFEIDPSSKTIRNDNIRLTSSYLDAGGFEGVNSFIVTGDKGLPTFMSIESDQFATFNVKKGSKQVSLYAGASYSSVDADRGSFNGISISNDAWINYIEGNNVKIHETVSAKTLMAGTLFVEENLHLNNLKTNGPVTSSSIFTGYIYPEKSDSLLGTSSGRWDRIYLKNQPNVSSDIRQKSMVEDIPKDLLERLSNIKPRQYIQNSEVHFGYIAQDVERELYKYCVDKYGWENAQKAMEQYAFLHKGESHLSLLYGEIAVLRDAMIQKRLEELDGIRRKQGYSKAFRKSKSKRLRNSHVKSKSGGVRK